MAQKRNLCAQIPLPLFNRVGAERDKAGQTNSEFITNLLTEYFMMKENGGANMAKGSGKERTLAFQISEELFQRIKAHLERETARTGQKLTQKDFVIGLIEAALAEAEQEAAAAQGADAEQQDSVEPDSAPDETAQETPCEDGVTTENGEASQPPENG